MLKRLRWEIAPLMWRSAQVRLAVHTDDLDVVTCLGCDLDHHFIPALVARITCSCGLLVYPQKELG